MIAPILQIGFLTLATSLLLIGCDQREISRSGEKASPSSPSLVAGPVYGNQGAAPELGISGTFQDAITVDGRLGFTMSLFDVNGNAVANNATPVTAQIFVRSIPIANVGRVANGTTGFFYNQSQMVRLSDKHDQPLTLGPSLIKSPLNVQMAYAAHPTIGQSSGTPAPCRLEGSSTFNGECYRGMLFAPLSPALSFAGESPWHVHAAPIELRVVAFDSAGRRLAAPYVVTAKLTDDFKPLWTKGWHKVAGAELSVTADGKLLFAQGTYYNDTADCLNGWSESIDVFTLHQATKDVSIGGIPLHKRYRLAAAPILDLLGRTCNEQLCAFDYPWVSQDGADLFFDQTSDATGPERASFTMVGARTRHRMIVVDNGFNHERLAGPGRTASLGLMPSMWSLFPEWDPSSGLLPRHKGEPVYLLFGRGMARFTEVPLRELVDDNYAIYLRMNEYVRPRLTPNEPGLAGSGSTLYSPRISKVTAPDTSGKGNHATLHAGAFFPQEAFETFPALPRNEYGFSGKAVFFKESGLMQVGASANLFPAKITAATWQFALQLFQLPSRRVVLAHQGQEWRILLSPTGALQMEGKILDAAGTKNWFQFDTGLTLPVGEWSHVTFRMHRIDGRSEMTAYVHRGVVEQKASFTLPAMGTLSTAMLPLRIGPGATGGSLTGDLLCAIDEFAISDLPRSVDHIRRAARFEAAPDTLLVGLDRPYTNPEDRTQTVTLTMEKLPASIRQYLDKENTNSSYDARDLHIPVMIAYYVLEKGRYAEAAALGGQLFNDQRLTGKNISCASCHAADRGFADPFSGPGAPPTSVGAAGRPLRRNTPTSANRIFSVRQFLDGRSSNLHSQAWKPILNPDEMAGDEASVIQYVKTAPEYGPLFGAVGVNDRASMSDAFVKTWIAVALTSFELEQILPNGLVDTLERRQNVNGQDPSVQSVFRGRALFYGKARCTNCHSGGNFSDENLHNTGTFTDLGKGISECGKSIDCGRFERSRATRDLGAFKTPTLRSLGKTAPYFHDGSVRSLKEVVEFYNQAIPRAASGRMSDFMTPLGLTPNEVDDLTAYLNQF